jgi:hypothetical protein
MLLATGLVAINIGYVASSLGFIHGPEAVAESDHYQYIALTRYFLHPPGDSPLPSAPFSYRVFTPLLAAGLTRLGLSMDTSYYLLSNLFLLLFLLTLFVYLRDLGFDRRMAAVGVIFAGLMQGAIRWYEYQYWMPDPACLFFIAFAFLLIHKKRLVPLICISAIAVTARETYLIIFGYYFLHTLKRLGLNRAVINTALLMILPMSIFIAIRFGVPTQNTYRLSQVAATMIPFRASKLFDNQLYFVTVGSLGVLFPLLLLYPKEIFGRIRRSYDQVAVIGAVYLSLLLANNTDRLLAYALPAMLPPVLHNIQRGFQDREWQLNAFVTIAIGVQILFFLQIRIYGMHISITQPVNYAVIGSMLALWGLGVIFRARNDGSV